MPDKALRLLTAAEKPIVLEDFKDDLLRGEHQKFLFPAMLLMRVSGRYIYLHTLPFIQATTMLEVHCWVPLYMAAQAQQAVGAQRTASGAVKLLLSCGGKAQGKTHCKGKDVFLEVLTFLPCTRLTQCALAH